MTEETQALVVAVEKLHETVYSVSGSAEIDAHRTIRDAAAALTALARDLETARQERDAALEQAALYDRMGALQAVEIRKHAAAVRAARAETWAEAAAWHEGMAESSVIPSLRPLHQQYSANFRERARLAAREEQ